MPDNGSYMHAAYAAAFLVYAVYTVGLWRRRSRVRAALRREGGRD
jgi:heme A synthase